MKYQRCVSVSFEAGHRVDGDPWCGLSPHGHAWVCSAYAQIDGSPLKGAEDKLRVAMEDIGRELARRDLNVMLPGTVTNTTGVANWLWDRLVMQIDGLMEVEASADGVSSKAYR